MERLIEAYTEYYLTTKFGTEEEAVSKLAVCKKIFKEEQLKAEDWEYVRDMIETKFY